MHVNRAQLIPMFPDLPTGGPAPLPPSRRGPAPQWSALWAPAMLVPAVVVAALFAASEPLTAQPPDPRPALVRAQIEGDDAAALSEAERLLVTESALAYRLGLDHLVGHLMHRMGRPRDAINAYLTSLTHTPDLALYSYYHLAEEHERLGRPEIAAGLVARVVASGTSFPRLDEAARLLRVTVGEGGDCRLLGAIQERGLPDAARREVRLARVGCALADDDLTAARGGILDLLTDEKGDEVARIAADVAEERLFLARDRRLAREVGMTLHVHREFERSSALLDPLLAERQQALARQAVARGARPGSGFEGPLGRDDYDLYYARARNDFWVAHYDSAAERFARLAEHAPTADGRADSLFQAGRCLELLGSWPGAAAAFREAYLAEPDGAGWAGASLLAALRLEWRRGRESQALELYELLLTKRGVDRHISRASLFLASSQLVRVRTQGVDGWLGDARRAGAEPREVAYWRGRLAELEKRPDEAVGRYLEAMRGNPHHPFGRLAAERLEGPALAPRAEAAGLRLSVSGRISDLIDARLLLGGDHPRSRQVEDRLVRMLAASDSARPFLALQEIPVERWPLWRSGLQRPEEMLLALGLWREGGPAVSQHFPLNDPSLAFTASRHLARFGELQHSVRIAEILDKRRPSSLPHAVLPEAYRRLLYPLPYSDLLIRETEKHGVPPALLAAIIREESRFDTRALSGASARGLTQFTQPTSQRFAEAAGLVSLEAEDLYDPAVAIALGAAYLADLGREFPKLEPARVASYNAGEEQAKVWQSHCFSKEPAEYISKVSFTQTRAYVDKVLTSRAQYADIYGDDVPGMATSFAAAGR